MEAPGGAAVKRAKAESGDESETREEGAAAGPHRSRRGKGAVGAAALCVIIRTCVTCMHSTNEPNPFTSGPHKDWAHWPWAHGESGAPIGKQCRVCSMAFILAGFNLKYKGLKELYRDMKTSKTLTDEFVNCGKKLIHLANDGVIKTRVKGSLKDEVSAIMGEIRTKTVEVIKRTGVHVKERFRAVTLTRWKKKYPSSGPKAEGMLMKELEIHGEKQMCVLVRQLPAGEFDVEVDESLETLLRETYDNGKLSLRDNQQSDMVGRLQRGQVAQLMPDQGGKEIPDERMVQKKYGKLAGPGGADKKGRGKGSIIPSDPNEILKRDKFFEVENIFKDVERLMQEPFDSTLISMGDAKEFQQEGKKLLTKLQGVQKDIVRVETLVSRRQNTPQEVTNKVKALRAKVRHLIYVMTELLSVNKAVDAERLNTCIGILSADDADPGAAMKVMLFRNVCADLVRFDKTETLKAELDLEDGFCARYQLGAKSDRQLVNKYVVESGLFKILDLIAGKKSDADRNVLQRAICLCEAAKDSVPDEMSQCLRSCIVIFGSAEDGVDFAVQETEADAAQEKKRDTASAGFMKAIMHHESWPRILSMARAAIAEKKKRTSGQNLTRQLQTSFAKLLSQADFSSGVDLADAESFKSSLANVLADIEESDPNDPPVQKFVEFLKAHKQATLQALGQAAGELGGVIDSLLECTEKEILETRKCTTKKFLERVREFVQASSVHVELVQAKPWRYKSEHIEDAVTSNVKAENTAGQYVELLCLLCDCAAQHDNVSDESSNFFGVVHSMNKLVEQMGGEIGPDLREMINRFKDKFNVEGRGKLDANEKYLPDLRRRSAIAISKLINPDKPGELDAEVANAAVGLEPLLHKAQQALALIKEGDDDCMVAKVIFNESVVKIAQFHHQIWDFGVNTATPPDAFLKPCVKLVHSALKTPGGAEKIQQFMLKIFPTLDADKVESFSQWIVGVLEYAADYVDNRLEVINAKAEEADAALDVLTDEYDIQSSTHATTEAYKAARIALKKVIGELTEATAKYDLPLSRYPIIESGDRKVGTALEKICYWGVNSLLKKEDIENEKTGKDARKVLRDIWANQILAKGFQPPADVAANVTNVLAVDKKTLKSKKAAGTMGDAAADGCADPRTKKKAKAQQVPGAGGEEATVEPIEQKKERKDKGAQPKQKKDNKEKEKKENKEKKGDKKDKKTDKTRTTDKKEKKRRKGA
ncbi:unnamed protein product, partial [Prorocentrum cordatum]